MTMAHLRSVSLFSGCGGMDIGLREAGFQPVLATDSEELCAETWRRNYPTTPFTVTRVGDLTQDDLLSKMSGVGRIDLLAGGPPCPSFSKSRFYRKEMPR